MGPLHCLLPSLAPSCSPRCLRVTSDAVQRHRGGGNSRQVGWGLCGWREMTSEAPACISLRCTKPRPLLPEGGVGWALEWVLSSVSPWPQVSDGSLTVTSVSREDRGAYTCRAYSIQGEAIHTTHLLVQGDTDFSDFSVPRAFFRDFQPIRAATGVPGPWLAQLGAGGSGQPKYHVLHGGSSHGGPLWLSHQWHEAPCWGVLISVSVQVALAFGRAGVHTIST